VKQYALVLALIGAGRLIELRISRSHQAAMAARGVGVARERGFHWMVLLHAGVLIGSLLEVRHARRPWIPLLGVPMALTLVATSLLRWWVIRTMGGQWTVRVMDAVQLGVVSGGPFRWIRHPNYVAVFVELEAIPLLHGAWMTALVGSLVHLWVLRRRLAVEEEVLLASPAYRAVMASKPRFVPLPSRLRG
jgi:methyltransferase